MPEKYCKDCVSFKFDNETEQGRCTLFDNLAATEAAKKETRAKVISYYSENGGYLQVSRWFGCVAFDDGKDKKDKLESVRLETLKPLLYRCITFIAKKNSYFHYTVYMPDLIDMLCFEGDQKPDEAKRLVWAFLLTKPEGVEFETDSEAALSPEIKKKCPLLTGYVTRFRIAEEHAFKYILGLEDPEAVAERERQAAANSKTEVAPEPEATNEPVAAEIG